MKARISKKVYIILDPKQSNVELQNKKDKLVQSNLDEDQITAGNLIFTVSTHFPIKKLFAH